MWVGKQHLSHRRRIAISANDQPALHAGLTRKVQRDSILMLGQIGKAVIELHDARRQFLRQNLL